MGRLLSLDNYVAATLMDINVSPMSSQSGGEVGSIKVARVFIRP
jgi:hypothetical protein